MQKLLKALGPVTAVIGAQWGDEGKGKVVDILAKHYDIIARACGGANAGHTIVVDGNKTIFHLIPSGALHEGKEIVLGAGMVNHLPTLLEEIQVLRKAGIDIVPRLHIASSAHILFEYHKEIDGVLEDRRSYEQGEGIGTTKRGIGPAYMDKAERTGLRMEKLNAPDDELKSFLANRAQVLKDLYGIAVNIEKEFSNLKAAQSIIGTCITSNVPNRLQHYLHQGKTMIIEGAQATLLDIDHGTYPYVTSSSTTILGALQGLGQPPDIIKSCVGVAKAYCTRVGSGDFASEADYRSSERLRTKGGEFGATTGRPRRCGWLNISDLQYAAMINGYSHWNITKLDVLDDESEVPVMIDDAYVKLPGWKSPTVGITQHELLPENAKNYIAFIEEHTKVPVALIGTGPGRDEIIIT